MSNTTSGTDIAGILSLAHMTRIWWRAATPQGLSRVGRCAPNLLAPMRDVKVSWCHQRSDGGDGSPFWPQLATAAQMTALDLSSCTRAALLAAAPHFSHTSALQRLDLSRNDLQQSASAIVERATALPSLRHFAIDRNGISGHTAAACAESLARMPALETLSMNGNRVDAQGMRAVARSLSVLTGLREIGLAQVQPRGQPLPAKTVSDIASSLAAISGLFKLELSRTECSCEGLHALFAGVHIYTMVY
jgi:Leucine-rich repeat (LRR) protein